MRTPVVALAALALSGVVGGCSARGSVAPPPAPRAQRVPALTGVRLRPRTDQNDLDPPRPPESDEHRGWVGASGPSGDAGYDVYDSPYGYDPYGYGAGPVGSGPHGAVPPGLRPPSDAPVLVPASPYRGPADPPDVYRRPGTASGNDTFRAR
jgi:hypothetical protein